MIKKLLYLSVFLICNHISAQITINLNVNKTNDVAPFKLFVDASETEDLSITNTLGEEWNFHNLHYKWDFGDDPNAVWENTGKNKNIGYGAIYGHVYDNPGNYTVTLTVSNPLTGEEKSTIITITVTDPDVVFAGENTICFSTSGDFNEAPIGALTVTTSDLKEALNTYAKSGKRLLFKRGEIWTPEVEYNNGNIVDSKLERITEDGPGIIGAFGTGDKPVFKTVVGVSGSLIRMSENRLNTTKNWRIMDLELDGSNNTENWAVALGGSDMLLYRVDMHDVDGGIGYGGSGLDWEVEMNGYDPEMNADFGIVECTINDIGRTTSSIGGVGIFGACERQIILGTDLIDNTNGEHNIRLVYATKTVLGHNYIADPALTKQTLTIRSNDFENEVGIFKDRNSHQIIVSDNIFSAYDTFQMSNSGLSANGADRALINDIILERNYIEAGGTVTSPHTTRSFRNSIRNNIFINHNEGAISVSQVHEEFEVYDVNIKIYNNSIYTNEGRAISLKSEANIDDEFELRGCEIYNNLVIGDPEGTEKIKINAKTTDALVSDNVQSLTPGTVSTSYNEVDDFLLLSTSSLIDAGKEVPNPLDYFGNKRNISSIDIGAIEFNNEDNTLSSDYIDEVFGVKVYPNPVLKTLSIELKEEIKKLELFSIKGEKILDGIKNKLDVSILPSGLYVLKINTLKGEIIRQKVIKK